MIGQTLLQDGVISQSMLQAVLRHQDQGHQRFCSVAVQLGFLTEKQALHYLGAQASYPTVTTWELLRANELGSQISIEFAQQHKIIPFRRYHRSILVAMVEPENDSLRLIIEKEVGAIGRPILALEVAIDFALAHRTQPQDGKPNTPATHEVSPDPVRTDTDHIESVPSEIKRSADELIAIRRSREYLRHGIVKLRDRNIDAAIDALEQSVQLDPFHDRTQYYLGRAWVENDDIEAARIAFERAAALNPSEFSTLFALARCYELLDRPNDAIQTWRDALLRAPDHGVRQLIASKIEKLSPDKDNREEALGSIVSEE